MTDIIQLHTVQSKRRPRQEKEYTRQDQHVSTPWAGQGFAAPSFVGGCGGWQKWRKYSNVANHNEQYSLPPSFASVSAASLAAFLDTAASSSHSYSSCLALPDHVIQDLKALVRSSPLPNFTPRLCQAPLLASALASAKLRRPSSPQDLKT